MIWINRVMREGEDGLLLMLLLQLIAIGRMLGRNDSIRMTESEENESKEE